MPASQYPRHPRNSSAPQHPRALTGSPALLHPGVPVWLKVLEKLVVPVEYDIGRCWQEDR
ncbi:hypothetical protein NG798_22550 [Ancylothrix sp. C2]|nr:hypothetical protein [Ancylothrix sp. D3o]